MVRRGSEKAHRTPAQDQERRCTHSAPLQSRSGDAGPTQQPGRTRVRHNLRRHSSGVRAGLLPRRHRWPDLHDLRHEATSRLFEKGFNPMEVSAITGHKTLQMLKRYTHLRAEDLAKRMG